MPLVRLHLHVKGVVVYHCGLCGLSYYCWKRYCDVVSPL